MYLASDLFVLVKALSRDSVYVSMFLELVYHQDDQPMSEIFGS